MPSNISRTIPTINPYWPRVFYPFNPVNDQVPEGSSEFLGNSVVGFSKGYPSYKNGGGTCPTNSNGELILFCKAENPETPRPVGKGDTLPPIWWHSQAWNDAVDVVSTVKNYIDPITGQPKTLRTTRVGTPMSQKPRSWGDHKNRVPVRVFAGKGPKQCLECLKAMMSIDFTILEMERHLLRKLTARCTGGGDQLGTSPDSGQNTDEMLHSCISVWSDRLYACTNDPDNQSRYCPPSQLGTDACKESIINNPNSPCSTIKRILDRFKNDPQYEQYNGVMNSTVKSLLDAFKALEQMRTICVETCGGFLPNQKTGLITDDPNYSKFTDGKPRKNPLAACPPPNDCTQFPFLPEIADEVKEMAKKYYGDGPCVSANDLAFENDCTIWCSPNQGVNPYFDEDYTVEQKPIVVIPDSR